MTGLAVFLCGLDHLVLLSALPAIRAGFHPGESALSWLINAYLIPVAVLPPCMALFGGRFGQRRVFTAALLVFTAGSAAAGCAPGMGFLIAARAVQGIGAAAITPLSLTLVVACLPARRRSVLLGVWGAIGGFAVAVGPLAGGAALAWGSWRDVFWINVPLGCALALAVPICLREQRADVRRLRWPPLLAAGTVLALAAFLLTSARDVSFPPAAGTAATALTVAAVLGCAAGWAYRYRRAGAQGAGKSRRWSAGRSVAGVHVCGFLLHAAVFGTVFHLVQFPQQVQGHSPWDAALRILPWTAMPVLAAPLAGLVMSRTGARPVLVGGCVLTGASSLWFALTLTPATGYLLQLPGLVAGGAGMALFFTASPQALLDHAPPGALAAASGINASVRKAGAVAGVAATTALFTAHGSASGPAGYTQGLIAVLWAAVLLAAGAAAAGLLPRPPRTNFPVGRPSRRVDPAGGDVLTSCVPR
ncbi:MFS transporter [Streptomyces sp. NPDC055254]